jgi:hypothetical protein
MKRNGITKRRKEEEEEEEEKKVGSAKSGMDATYQVMK